MQTFLKTKKKLTFKLSLSTIINNDFRILHKSEALDAAVKIHNKRAEYNSDSMLSSTNLQVSSTWKHFSQNIVFKGLKSETKTSIFQLILSWRRFLRRSRQALVDFLVQVSRDHLQIMTHHHCVLQLGGRGNISAKL